MYLNTFEMDLKKISDKFIKNKVKEIILSLKNAKGLNEISQLKKIKASNIAYRIRINDYRLGFYYINNKIELSRLVHRKDIYKHFP